jgi:hypothetical protein
VLNVFSNGEINYKLKGVHAKVSVIWNYKAPEGAGDTHFSVMKGTRANLEIRQGADEKYVPELYIKPHKNDAAYETALTGAFEKVKATYPGVELKKGKGQWQVRIPEQYRVGHEAHFGEGDGTLPGLPRSGQTAGLGSTQHAGQVLHYYHCPRDGPRKDGRFR